MVVIVIMDTNMSCLVNIKVPQNIFNNLFIFLEILN